MKKRKPKVTRADRIKAINERNFNRDIRLLNKTFDRIDSNINTLREII